jgi:hypothetical protein
MNGGIEEAFAPTLGALTVTGILLDIGDQPSIENTLAIIYGIKATIEVEIELVASFSN